MLSHFFENIFLYNICISFLFVIYGLFLVKNNDQCDGKDLLNLFELIQESYFAFFKRCRRSLLQVLLLICLMFILFPLIISSGFNLLPQMFSFLLGATMCSLPGFYCLSVVLKRVPGLFAKTYSYSKETVFALYDFSAGIAFVLLGSVVIGFFVSMVFFGLDSIIGYGLGTLLSTFYLRGTGLLYQVSSMMSQMISKQEFTVPDDQRNPATILSILGRYLGDIIGFSTDILSSLILGYIAVVYSIRSTKIIQLDFVANIPPVLIFMGLSIAILAYLLGALRLKFRHQNILLENVYLTVFFNILFSWFLFDAFMVNNFLFNPYFSYLSGVLGIVVIALVTDFFTNRNYHIVKEIAISSQHGSLVSTLSSINMAYKSNAIYIMVLLSITLSAAYFSGLIGVALSVLGLMSVSLSLILAKVFSSIASNMSFLNDLLDGTFQSFQNVNLLNRLGHTVSVIGNGVSASVGFISSIVILMVFLNINLNVFYLVMDYQLLLGMGFGVVFFYWYSASLMSGVSKSTQGLIKEILRQFKEIPFLTEGKTSVDSFRASDRHSISVFKITAYSGPMMLIVPLFLVACFDSKVLLGFLIGASFLVACSSYNWANFSDMLDTASQQISQGYFGGAESRNFKAINRSKLLGNLFGVVLSPNVLIMLKVLIVVSMIIWVA